MSYKKEKVKILDPKQGYDKISSIYKKFHSKLDKWDLWIWQRFLPRDLHWKTLLDIWAWDCRMAKFFKDKGLAKYVAFDISEEMLKKCKSWVDTVVWDINKKWPFEDDSFDIELAFFVLMYADNLNHFFSEVYRTLKSWWRLILQHHIERKPYVYKINWEEFEIDYTAWRFEEIEKAIEYNFLNYEFIDLQDWWGRIYVVTKF